MPTEEDGERRVGNWDPKDRCGRKPTPPWRHLLAESHRHHSPGQGEASSASLAAALGHIPRSAIGRAMGAACHRLPAEAETTPPIDCSSFAPWGGEEGFTTEPRCPRRRMGKGVGSPKQTADER